MLTSINLDQLLNSQIYALHFIWHYVRRLNLTMELQNLVSESIRTSRAILPASSSTFPYKKERESLLLSHDNTLYTAEKFIVCSKLFRVQKGER